jgi:hypothetical protein
VNKFVHYYIFTFIIHVCVVFLLLWQPYPYTRKFVLMYHTCLQVRKPCKVVSMNYFESICQKGGLLLRHFWHLCGYFLPFQNKYRIFV